jgi:hypothetical protein
MGEEKVYECMRCGRKIARANLYRTNTLIDEHFSNHAIRVFSHDYFVGPTTDLRHEIEEALIIKPESAAKPMQH